MNATASAARPTQRSSGTSRRIVTGGLPEWGSTSLRVQQAALDGYLHRAVDHDVPLMGYRARQPGTVRRWLTAYAAATATTATYETIRDAATAGEGDKPAKTVVYHSDFWRGRFFDPTFGPGFCGFGALASTSPTIHSASRSVSVTPADMAGVIFSVLWIRQKL